MNGRKNVPVPPVPGRGPPCLTAHEPRSALPLEEKGPLKSLCAWVYRTTEGLPVFHEVGAPTAEQLQTLLARIITRLMKFLTRKGFLIEEQGMSYLADTDPDTALGPLRAAACTYRIALGPRAGQKVLSLQTVPTREPPLTPVRCVDELGFSLHAEVCCAAHERHKL